MSKTRPLRLALWLACALVFFGCEDEAPQAPADMGAAQEDVADATPDLTPDASPDLGEDASPDLAGDAPDIATADVEEDAPLAPGTLVIEPADLILRLEPNEQREVMFAAAVVGEDGSLEALPDARWRVTNPALGGIDAQSGVWRGQGVGGQATVTAATGLGEVSTTFKVILTSAPLGEGVTQDDLAALDDAPALDDQARAPELLYPEDGTVIPQNLVGVTLQWQPRDGRLFQVQIRSDSTEVTHTTRQSTWAPDGALWGAIARSNLGRSVSIRVEALDSAGQRLTGAPASALEFSQDVVRGAIYYWSTADAGIMRLPVGEDQAERFFTPLSPAGSPCVGCHALSRDGKRMAFNTAPVGIPIGPLMQISAEDPTQRIIDLDQNINGMQPTFSPDASRIVSGWSGVLTERDANGRCEDDMARCTLDADCATGACVTGAPIAALPNPQGFKVAFPDWSPDDRWLVAAGNDSPVVPLIEFQVPNASLILYPRPGGEWGQPSVIIRAQPGESHYNPSFSPNSDWIAYNYSAGVGGGGNSQGVPDAELRLLSPTRRQPIVLARANKGPALANSWPKWAPTEGRFLWLAFSSTRAYGSLGGGSSDTPQIWVTAIDPVDAGNGVDPSRPAFWLPGQRLTSGNHIPFWATYEKPQQEDPDAGE